MERPSNLDKRTRDYITGEIAVQLEQELLDLNMDILNRIKAAKGAVDRVTANVDKKLDTVFALEAKADDLSNKATAPAIRQLDSINSELTEIVNALEGNGGPDGPLPGDSQSANSEPVSGAVDDPGHPMGFTKP